MILIVWVWGFVLFYLKQIGYVATPKMVVQACYTLLSERNLVPNGVLTPALAFGKTRLIERLQEHGIVFSTVQQPPK
jgi:short subunit dehydrogenase-like uncharacterized protein